MGVFITSPIGNSSPLTKFARDATVQSVTADTTLATLAVSAASCTQYILIIVDCDTTANGAAGTGGANILVDIDVTNRFNQPVANYILSSVDDIKVGTTAVFYYEPSAGEKSAGFNVVIKCDVGAATSTFNYRSATVMGY